MPKRYLILLGAQTTAGGTVKTASSFMSYNGLPYALEGDLVDCPACGQEGQIQCVAPRLDARYNGRQYALEHDLCLCGCSPPPRLVANQQHNCQLVSHASDAIALNRNIVPVPECKVYPALQDGKRVDCVRVSLLDPAAVWLRCQHEAEQWVTDAQSGKPLSRPDAINRRINSAYAFL